MTLFDPLVIPGGSEQILIHQIVRLLAFLLIIHSKFRNFVEQILHALGIDVIVLIILVQVIII